MHRLVRCWVWVSLMATGACVEADPINSNVDFGLPDHTDAIPSGALASSGLAVVDSNPGQFLHLFTDSVPPNRKSMNLDGTGTFVVPLVINGGSTMPGPSEQWRTVVQSDGQIWLQQPALNLCVGGDLTLHTCGAANTSWQLVPVLYSDLARVRNGGTGQCMSITDDGNSIVSSSCASANVWRFELISATGAGMTGQGYGTVQVSAKGTLNTLGSASSRPCTDVINTYPSLGSLNWLQVSNGGDSPLALVRVDADATVDLGSLPAHASEVLQVPAGSVVRFGNNDVQCLGYVDTAVMLRVNGDGSFLAQGCSLHACTEQSTLHSVSSLRTATLRVVNKTSEVLTLNWLDYAAGDPPAPYGSVANGASTTEFTFQTHPWLFSAPDGTCRGILTLNSDPQP